MKLLVGGLIAGLILFFVPGLHSGPACVLAGALLAFALIQAGPRSLVEKVGLVMTVSLIAWIAGPRAATGQSLLRHLFGWFLAGSALAYYLHPKSD